MAMKGRKNKNMASTNEVTMPRKIPLATSQGCA